MSRPLFVLDNNRYEVVNHLGQGGMGTVYAARDRRLSSRQCVVKKLRDDFFRLEDKERAIEFFKREVVVLADLQHPNIVQIHDSFEENGDFYLVMEYVEGENLHQMLHRRGEPFPEEQVLVWISQVLDVLEYLHTHDPQIIYRDLKPSNIMIDTKDRVKLVDFGIARPYVEEADNTHVVSAGYSPPEQYWGAADKRSDIYALGMTMYFLLTGEEPLALQTAFPRKINPNVSVQTDLIVQRATAQDILLRYQSAAEMKQELAGWRGHKKERSAAANVAIVTLASLIGLALFGAGATFVGNLIEDKNRAEQETKAIHLREQELDKRTAALKRITDTQQGKLTDIVTTRTTNTPRDTDPQKPTPATVAFREVDESMLTDPDDGPNEADLSTSTPASITMPAVAPQRKRVNPSPQPVQTKKAAAPVPPPVPVLTAPYAKGTAGNTDEFDSQANQ